VKGVEDGEEVAHLVEGSGVTHCERVHPRQARRFAERGVDPGAPPQGSKLSGQAHTPHRIDDGSCATVTELQF